MKRVTLSANAYPIDGMRVRPLFGVSVRKLTSSYNGPCMRVRRSSDNAERDIYFAGRVMNLTALREFVGANSGYVVTWYDQFSTNHPTQATAGSQPRIINAGTLDTIGNIKTLPAVRATGSQYLSSSTVPAGTTSMGEFHCSFVTVERASTTASHVVFNPSGSTDRISVHTPYLGTAYFDFGSTSYPQRISASYPPTTNTTAIIAVRNSVAANVKSINVNNAAIVTGTGTTASASVVQIFSRAGAEFANAGIGELMMWNTYLSDSENTALHNNQKAYFGV